MKYLEKYYLWMETEAIPDEGLCQSLKGSSLFKLFEPTEKDDNELLEEGLPTIYWASGEVKYSTGSDRNTKYMRRQHFSPLRQTIVLFCAAMNDEL